MSGSPRRFRSRSFSLSRRSFSRSSLSRDRGRRVVRLLERLRLLVPRSRDRDRVRLLLLALARLPREPDRLLRLSLSL